MAGSLARLSKYCPTPYLLQRCLTASNKTCTDDSPGLLDTEYIISYNNYVPGQSHEGNTTS